MFYAYEVGETARMQIEPASLTRAWMDETDDRFAYRCLPMVLANQEGWMIPSPVRFSARWNGGPREDDLRLSFGRGGKDSRISSHFGSGVVTFSIPYLFRTPKEINLWVKGPSNRIKDGAQPLEAIVETDWSAATFTMNWKLTRRNHAVRFEEGEPICMLVPVHRHLADGLRPRREPLANNKELASEHSKWAKGRSEFNTALARCDPDVVKRGWQKDYTLGLDVLGSPYHGHQMGLKLKPFERSD